MPLTRLETKILNYGQTHHPAMVKEMIQARTLQNRLHEAEKRAADLLYEYLSVQKMDYVEAWDLMMKELSPTSNPSPSPRATSESPNPTG